MKYSLYYQNLAPTAAHTLNSYPFTKKDPLLMQATPDLYLCGNSESFSEYLLKVEDSVTKLLCVPKFSKTGEVIILDLSDYKAYKVSYAQKIHLHNQDEDVEMQID